jgi:hypothetical protein
MSFKSDAQRKYMFANPEVLGEKGLHEWAAASKGKKLPEHVKKPSYAQARAARKESK